MKFKIKKQEYENRTFRLPVELLEQLNKLASDKNISLNQLVVQCCEYAIDNLDDSEQYGRFRSHERGLCRVLQPAISSSLSRSRREVA